jgi:hypothetical protein
MMQSLHQKHEFMITLMINFDVNHDTHDYITMWSI